MVQAVTEDYRRAPIDSPTRALLEYAEKVTRNAAKITKDDVDFLRRENFSDEAILDAACVTSYFNYVNRMTDALGVELEEIFEDKAKAK